MTPTREQELVPCPLCGAEHGYTLGEGSTYRWWSVKCASCGQEVAEARATYPAETTPRTARADEAWNQAGAYANGLREQLAAAHDKALEDAAAKIDSEGIKGFFPAQDAAVADWLRALKGKQ